MYSDVQLGLQSTLKGGLLGPGLRVEVSINRLAGYGPAALPLS